MMQQQDEKKGGKWATGLVFLGLFTMLLLAAWLVDSGYYVGFKLAGWNP